MKSILRMLAIVNNNYDKTGEPERFITGIAFSLGPWFIADALSMVLHSVALKVFAVLWIVGIVCMRMLWVTGYLKNYLPRKKD